ncbi:hypothetical protein [Natronobiforma cellulositropha]|uniref:hypothetical protein n=1 Tax=Natronobiforma cellulositropha TaxID=1679076 RepID=UPI0021D5C76D|nr:hypothetical protein [Natronobiforma cellulositropha]
MSAREPATPLEDARPEGRRYPGRLSSDPPWLWQLLLTVVVLPATFAFVAGPVGALAGLLAGVVWYVAGTPYAVAVGYASLLVVFPTGTDTLSLALVTGAFVVCILASAGVTASPVRFVVAALVASAALVGGTWYAATTWPLWLAAASSLSVFALAAYGVHRSELVALGLVSEADDDTGDDTPTDGDGDTDTENTPTDGDGDTDTETRQ